jgi:hypothetical protein
MKRSNVLLPVGVGSLFIAGAVALLGLAVSALRSGMLDVRPEHAPVSRPEWLAAAEEPFWFYGLLALIASFAACLLVVGWRMIREARKPR